MSPVAQRLRVLRSVITGDNAAAFAVQIGISTQRWHNFENGYPLSKEIAFKLVEFVPGLTLDWLYLGNRAGLSLDLARQLGEATSPGKGTTRPPRGS